MQKGEKMKEGKMDMEICVSKWSVLVNDRKQKTIGGKYQVKMNGNVISESEFNEGYNSTEITIPAEILVEAESLDSKIREAIIKNFTS